MGSMDRAIETQLANIQKRTGKTLDELRAIIVGSGLARHGELRDMLRRDLGMGHGDASMLIHVVLRSDGERAAKAAGASDDDVIDQIYSGARAHLRPIHDRLMEELERFGEFDVAPKKGYVSLRRRKQFAMIGPATRTRVEVGLNMKGPDATERLIAVPAGGMCQYKVNVTEAGEVDEELVAWLRTAYENAG